MKRKYSKPAIKKVRLAPEEAVLSACKTTMNGKVQNSRCAENNCRNKVAGS